MNSDDEYFESAAKGLRPFSDFEWFAVDRDGFIAFLTSAGLGPIPTIVFKSKPDYFALQHWFNDAPFRGEYVVHPPAKKMPRPDDFLSMARKGLFAYDWDCSKGQYLRWPYHLIASPERPLLIHELPDSAKATIEQIRFDVSFRESSALEVENFFDDLN